MRSAILVVVAMLALVGCGNAEEQTGGPTPRETFDLFVAAVKKGGAEKLVSSELDEDDRASFVRAMRSDVEQWGRSYRVIFDELLGDGVAVVAAQGDKHLGPGAQALVLVKDGERWYVQPNRLQLVYGASAAGGTSATKPDLDFQVNVAGQNWKPKARMWLDRRELRLRAEADPTLYTFRSDLRRLERRLYTAVAYAEAGDRRGAIAWTFQAR